MKDARIWQDETCHMTKPAINLLELIVNVKVRCLVLKQPFTAFMLKDTLFEYM
jgi:hypothetical protein